MHSVTLAVRETKRNVNSGDHSGAETDIGAI